MKTKKVIFITGASSGIGKATAERLISEGHIVYGAARRVDKMKDLVDVGGHAIAMDVLDEGQMQAAVDQVIEEQGRIDVLVNNAGYAVYGSVEDITIDEARRQFEVNIFGLARLTQMVLPHMREKKSGTIINMSSVGGKIFTPLGAWYHATKHALEGWSDCLRIEVEPFGIDVVLVEPGAIQTEFVEVMNQPMLDRSTGGPYEKMAVALANAGKDTYDKPGRSSGPEVIAATISKAIKSRRPKTRYASGKMSGLLLFLRKWLSDRAFQKLMVSQLKIEK
jgi:NAD(P)-dependent dehydrogenase (short-subunit alcohol dehydrogenase family)